MRGLKRIAEGCLLVLVLVFNVFIGAAYVPSPTNLEISSGANGLTVILTWSFVHPDSADGFIIYKNETPIDSIATDTTSYTDNSQVLGYYYVTAYKGTEESNPSNTVSDTVIVTTNLQIWEWGVPDPSGFGWDTLTGIGHVYYCYIPQNAKSIDFYLYDWSSLAIVSADEPPYEGNHTTAILNMGFNDFNIAPSSGYYNLEDVVPNAYYAVVTRLETPNHRFAKIHITSVSTVYPEYIIFDASYQLIKGLRLLGSMTAVKEEKSIITSPQKYLTVSPNPFITSTTISIPSIEHSAEGIELTIYDVSGRLVKAVPLTTNHFSLGTDLKPGVYFLKVDGFKPVKVVKLR